MSKAVIELRQSLGLNQQQFANRLKMAMTSIARYETSRTPKGKTLAQFARLAEQSGRHDIASIFDRALAAEIEGKKGDQSAEQQMLSRAIRAILIGAGAQDHKRIGDFFEHEFKRASKRAKDDPIAQNELDTLTVLIRLWAHGSAEREIEKRAKRISDRENVSIEQARALAVQREPSLYAAYEAERQKAATGTIFDRTISGPPKRKK
ncbi:MAG TPA: helix-turn-helix domain-containing protein, partial [Nitrososphaera sp.]|nr:helix-turn-helix domain-containing protein [Nitrososphaera sp.]